MKHYNTLCQALLVKNFKQILWEGRGYTGCEADLHTLQKACCKKKIQNIHTNLTHFPLIRNTRGL